MADEPDDVLELDPEDEIHEEEEAEEGSAEQAEEEDDESETIIGFEGEEAAPASESESSVIRELRRANRELAKRVAQHERGAAPQRIEVGEEPSLEGCDYDEDRFKNEWRAWNDRKVKADRQEDENKRAAEKQRTEWQQRAQAYEADKSKLNISDFDDAESEVFAALSDETKALLMLSEKPAALVYALSRNPAKLAELSKLNLARAAMMIGKLEDKVQMTRRKLPEPDRPVKGNAAPTTADKELARLENEAERTGERSALIAYRRKLRERA